jgi:hypothetical protein
MTEEASNTQSTTTKTHRGRTPSPEVHNGNALPPLVEWAEGILWLILLFWAVAALGLLIKPWFQALSWGLSAWATIFTLFSWPFGLALLFIQIAQRPKLWHAWRMLAFYLGIAAALLWPIGCTLAPLGSGVAWSKFRSTWNILAS